MAEQPRELVADVDIVDPRTALAFLADRQGYLTREGRTWTLVDDYTDQVVTTQGSSPSVAVRRWATALGLPTPTDIRIQHDPA